MVSIQATQRKKKYRYSTKTNCRLPPIPIIKTLSVTPSSCAVLAAQFLLRLCLSYFGYLQPGPETALALRLGGVVDVVNVVVDVAGGVVTGVVDVVNVVNVADVGVDADVAAADLKGSDVPDC